MTTDNLNNWPTQPPPPVESIACFHGVHDDCRNDDCPCECGHGFRNLLRQVKVGIEVDDAITKTNKEFTQVATMATVQAAIADVLDAGRVDDNFRQRAWLFLLIESDEETEQRDKFIEAVTARIAKLQSPPHSMDARLLEELRQLKERNRK